MKLTHLSVMISLVAMACGAELPSAAYAPTADAPTFSGGGGSDCEALQFSTQTSGAFPNFNGTMSGDLEGSVSVVLQAGPLTGSVFHNPGVETMTITGGAISELVGKTLTHEFVATNSFAPGQVPAGILNGHGKIIDGAAEGNFTFHGTFDFSAFPFVVELDYDGRICP